MPTGFVVKNGPKIRLRFIKVATLPIKKDKRQNEYCGDHILAEDFKGRKTFAVDEAIRERSGKYCSNEQGTCNSISAEDGGNGRHAKG